MSGPAKARQFRLRVVFWELTTGCNLRCILCRADADELMSPDDLSYGECCRIVDQVAEYAPLCLVLGGGEPLWRRDVFDLAKRAVARGLEVALATNGTLIDEAMAERVREAGIGRVSVAVDGADAVTHDTFRGRQGAFQAAVRGVTLLNELGVATQVNTTIARHNEHQLPEILALARRLGVNALHFSLLAPAGCGLTLHDEQAIEGEDSERILNWLHDCAPVAGLEIKASGAPMYYRIVSRRRGGARQTEPSRPASPKRRGASSAEDCPAGREMCFIAHDGEVFPCSYLLAPAGNLRELSFREIWDMAEVFDDLRATGKRRGKCGVCEHRSICLGCRAKAHGIMEDYMADQRFQSYGPANSNAQQNSADSL